MSTHVKLTNHKELPKTCLVRLCLQKELTRISPKPCEGMKIFRFLLLLAFSRPTSGDLIAKSSITICENTGGSDDPMSVVYEKACEKKLIVTMSVRSGQVRSSSGEIIIYLHCL